jgi:RNA 2',3'-cyclic 3'-phosphodiesterase
VGSDSCTGSTGYSVRLFVALELPEPVRAMTGAWAASQLGPIRSLRPVRTEGLHVTLCFLGSTGPTEIDRIAAACRDACVGQGPLRLSLGELVTLPRRRPRAVTVRVCEESHGQLAELQGGLAGALAAGGWYRPDPRPFLAHVTVARVRSRARLEGRALGEGAGAGVSPPVRRAPAAFTADVVTLFESRTQPGGAVYEPRARIELAA